MYLAFEMATVLAAVVIGSYLAEARRECSQLKRDRDALYNRIYRARREAEIGSDGWRSFAKTCALDLQRAQDKGGNSHQRRLARRRAERAYRLGAG